MPDESKDLMSENPMFDRLLKFESKELESNEEVQKILENASQRHLIFDLFGVPVKVVTAFPRDVRYFYEKNRGRQNQQISFKDVEKEGYWILSRLFIEAPYNTAEFWEYLDSKTGTIWGIFNSVYAGVEKSEEKIGDFRKK